jgi:hypothetical protein
VRIRIVTRPSGRIDGVPLDRFDPGATYDVNASIGTYLMSAGYAQAVADMSPPRIVPHDASDDRTRATQTRGTHPSANQHARKKR